MLDGSSENISSLLHIGKYCAINAEYLTTLVYYVINYLSESYTLQEHLIINRQLSKAGEPVGKDEYLSFMKAKIYWY